MKYKIINEVLIQMQGELDNSKLSKLKECMIIAFRNVDVAEQCTAIVDSGIDDVNSKFLKMFAVELKVNDLAAGTIKHYVVESKKFLEAVNKQFSQVTKDDVLIYLAELTRKGLSKNTVDNTRKYIKSFFSWLAYNDYISKSPFDRLRCTKREEVKKEILSEKEVEMMRDACETPKELAVFDFLNSTGMRVSEFTSLTNDSIDFNTGKVSVYAKKTKTYRDVFLDAKALKHLIDYKNDAANQGKKSDYLFANDRKSRGKYNRMKNNAVEKLLKNLSRKANISKKITVHTLRKTFACKLHKKGVRQMTIAALLGHADFSTSAKYYIKLTDGELRNEFERVMA